MALIKNKFFDQLRTKEQTGYVVQAKLMSYKIDNISLICTSLLIQSATHTPFYLRSRIKAFMKMMNNHHFI